MAEGHSFSLANNVILLAYSWAADKFKQALDRVHRLNSVKPGLESLTDEKTDAAELVLDGRLIGERPEEVNLAELLKVARREFNAKDNTLDEALLQTEWPKLRDQLTKAMRSWEPQVAQPIRVSPKATPELTILQAPAALPFSLRGESMESFMQKPEPKSRKSKHEPESEKVVQFPIRVLTPSWKDRLKLRVNKLARANGTDLCSSIRLVQATPNGTPNAVSPSALRK